VCGAGVDAGLAPGLLLLPMKAHPLRRALDGVYYAAGMLAAVFLLALLSIIVLQMAARWTGQVFPGSTNYAGYCMAAMSFLALAYALNHGAHIRVRLLLTRLGRFRRLGELWCYGIGGALSVYFCYYAIKATYWSHLLNDVSQGQDATPMWVPQLSMAIGTLIFALSMVDRFVSILLFGFDESAEKNNVVG